MMRRSAKAMLQHTEFQAISSSLKESAEVAYQHNHALIEHVNPRNPLQAARIRRR